MQEREIRISNHIHDLKVCLQKIKHKLYTITKLLILVKLETNHENNY